MFSFFCYQSSAELGRGTFVLLASLLQNNTANRDPICDIPRVQDMIQDDSRVHLAVCSVQHPQEWDLSVYLSTCDSTPSGTAHWHHFVSAVGLQP